MRSEGPLTVLPPLDPDRPQLVVLCRNCRRPVEIRRRTRLYCSDLCKHRAARRRTRE
ncbi:MAG: hypothetical protein ACRENX_09730 [Candidatus Dormibacteria bacterium]